jgi:hypothetical protein
MQRIPLDFWNGRDATYGGEGNWSSAAAKLICRPDYGGEVVGGSLPHGGCIAQLVKAQRRFAGRPLSAEFSAAGANNASRKTASEPRSSDNGALAHRQPAPITHQLAVAIAGDANEAAHWCSNVRKFLGNSAGVAREA